MHEYQMRKHLTVFVNSDVFPILQYEDIVRLEIIQNLTLNENVKAIAAVALMKQRACSSLAVVFVQLREWSSHGTRRAIISFAMIFVIYSTS